MNWKKRDMAYFDRKWVFVLICLSISSGVYADSYLDALESAADDLAVDPATTGGEAAEPDEQLVEDTAPETVGDMPVGMDQAALELFLEEKYLGSYAFYKRLDVKGKSFIYKEYVNTPSIEHVRRKIKEIYLQQ